LGHGLGQDVRFSQPVSERLHDEADSFNADSLEKQTYQDEAYANGVGNKFFHSPSKKIRGTSLC
jgi:hypothetical protein